MKTTGCVTTKYVYGNGLIGEETNGRFKTYHFDYRGSTVALTDACGNVTDTFEYDTYGKLIGRTGTSKVIFGYNGRDGVITDDNGLIYMRARYYSPAMKRFINADVVAGDIANAVTLNRYAYANGNPVSYVDPLGLEASRMDISFEFEAGLTDFIGWTSDVESVASRLYNYLRYGFNVRKKGAYAIIKGARSVAATSQGIKGTRYALKNAEKYSNVFSYIDPKTAVKSAFRLKDASGAVQWGNILGNGVIAVEIIAGVIENINEGTRTQKIISDAIVDLGIGIGTVAGAAAAGAALGSVCPGPGNVVGAIGGAAVGFGSYLLTDVVHVNGKSGEEWVKEGAGWVADRIVDIGEDIVDAAGNAWDATVDFVEDTGEWIGDAVNNAWNDVNGLFSEIFT